MAYASTPPGYWLAIRQAEAIAWLRTLALRPAGHITAATVGRHGHWPRHTLATVTLLPIMSLPVVSPGWHEGRPHNSRRYQDAIITYNTVIR